MTAFSIWRSAFNQCSAVRQVHHPSNHPEPSRGTFSVQRSQQLFPNAIRYTLTAILLALSFSFPNLWFLAWIGLAPFFFAVQDKSVKQIFFISYLTGVLFWLGAIYWLIHVSLAGLILLVLYLALFFAVFGVLSNLFFKKCFSFSFIFIPTLWISLEYIRSYLFTGFGWAILGYSQYTNVPIIQIADITGTYGVSFLIVMANVVLYLLIKKRKPFLPVISFIILLISTLIYGFIQLNQTTSGDTVEISVVQGNIPQEEKWDEKFKSSIFEKYKVLTRLANQNKPEVIIWPETSVPGYLLEEQKLYEEVTSLAKDIKTPLLVGAPIFDRDSGRSLNSAILFSKEGKVKQIHSKLHLVPFGEFVPFENILGFIRNSIVIGDFIPGKTYTLFSVKDNLKFGVLVCFEDIFPDLVRKFVNSGANFMVNITNDAWFKKTSAPYQHLQASVFRAVENRINVIRAANTGYSGFIGPTGKIINRVHKEKEEIEIAGYASQTLNLNSKATFYTRFGDVFALSCLFLSLIVILNQKTK